MARTKQTARHSTGEVGPRAPLGAYPLDRMGSVHAYRSVGEPKAKPVTLLVPASTQRLFTLRECVDCIQTH